MDFLTLKNRYFQERSDIVEHLPTLFMYAAQCQHVTEFGVREGRSTVALIAGCPGEVCSFDIKETPIVSTLRSVELPCKSWSFTEMNTGDTNRVMCVGETDMLFLDTLHTYDHLKKELDLHGRKAKKFLAFHDTETCWNFDQSGKDPRAIGIGKAIQEFLSQYENEYVALYMTPKNNGLLVLKRKCLKS